MPKTILGKWSIGLIVAMFVLFVIGFSLPGSMYEGIPAGDTILADVQSRPVLAISMLIGFGAGISALVTGLFSIIRHGERAVLVFVSTLIGAGFTVFLIAQFVGPQ